MRNRYDKVETKGRVAWILGALACAPVTPVCAWEVLSLRADPSVMAGKATSWTLGLNWYLNSNLKRVANCHQTRLRGGAAAGAFREDKKVVLTRVRTAF